MVHWDTPLTQLRSYSCAWLSTWVNPNFRMRVLSWVGLGWAGDTIQELEYIKLTELSLSKIRVSALNYLSGH
jgi:hypothetical protein